MENNTLSELQRTAMSFDTAILKPVFVGEDKTEDKNHFAVWNEDKEKVSAMVSPEYELIQHRMVVDGVAEALRDLGLDKEAQVSHIANSGDAVFIDINFPSAKLYCGLNEEFIGGIRIINSYNKTTSICVLPHVLRLACMNGLVVNVGVMKEFSVHHTNKLAKEFADIIPQILKSMIENNDKFKAMVNGAITDSVEWASMKIIVGALIKTDKHRDKIWEILMKQNKENYSRWDLLNSVTQYCTHNGKLTPLVQNMLQTKAKTVLVTPLAQLMPKQEIPA
jgi:hypothetical protein